MGALWINKFIGIGKIIRPEDEARVKAVREAVGDDVELMVDANCLMKFDAALRWCKRLEPYNLMWFEEPILYNDTRLLAELRKRTSIPIGAGERENFSKLCELARAVSRPSATRCRRGWRLHDGHEGGGCGSGLQSSDGNGDDYDLHLHGAVPNGWRNEFCVPTWSAVKVIHKDPPNRVNDGRL